MEERNTERVYARYMIMKTIFEHQAWAEVVAELENEIAQQKSVIAEAKSWDEVRFAQGRIDALTQIVYLEAGVDNVLDMIVQSNPEEYPDADV